MSRDIAKAFLVGRLTRDPDLHTLNSGKTVCQLGVAVGYSYKDASGEWVDKPSFFDVTVWGPQGENCAKYLTKGRQVAVDGRLDQRTWEAQDGTKRSKVAIVADQVVFLGGQPEGQQQASKPAVARENFDDIDFGDEGEVPY